MLIVVTEPMKEWGRVTLTNYKTLKAMGHKQSAAAAIAGLKASLEIHISAAEIAAIRQLLRVGQFTRLVDGADVYDSRCPEGIADNS